MIAKLDDFLRVSDRDILRHAGRITHEQAVMKAELEYERFAAARAELPARVEIAFEEAASSVKLLEKARPPRAPTKGPHTGRKKP